MTKPDSLGTEEINPRRTGFAYIALLQVACLIPYANAKRARQMVAAHLPSSANLANMEIIAVKLRPFRPGLRPCREISVVYAIRKIQVLRRRKRGRHAEGRVVISRHHANQCRVLKNRRENQTGY